MWDVLGFGVVAVDDLVYVDGYPAPDSKMPIREEWRDGGGLAGTALVAAARLGARVAYGGVLGDDDLSRWTIAEFERTGVDCSLIRRQAGARPVHSVIIVDRLSGQRSVLYSAVGTVEPNLDDFREAILRCRVLFLDNTILTFARGALHLAREHHIPVVADLERTPDEATLAFGRQVDHLIISRSFGSRLTGKHNPMDILSALHSSSHTACVVTAGEQGCWYISQATGNEIQHQPAFPVQAVNTNGCGDVFHGAYAASIASGESVEQAILVATATAGLKAARPGGRSGIPDRPTVERFLQKHSKYKEADKALRERFAVHDSLEGDNT